MDRFEATFFGLSLAADTATLEFGKVLSQF
jgi:hypothetical protein